MKRLIAFVVVTMAAPHDAFAWQVLEKIDAITDAKRTIAVAEGDGGALVLKCDRNGPSTVYAHLVSKKYLGEGRDRSRAVIQRFDGGEPISTFWSHSKDGALLSSSQKQGVSDFVRRLSTARKLVMRATTYDYDYVDFSLDVAGADAAIRTVYAGCGDTLPY